MTRGGFVVRVGDRFIRLSHGTNASGSRIRVLGPFESARIFNREQDANKMAFSVAGIVVPLYISTEDPCQ